MWQGSLQRQGNYEKKVKKTESEEIKVITSTKLSKSYLGLILQLLTCSRSLCFTPLCRHAKGSIVD